MKKLGFFCVAFTFLVMFSGLAFAAPTVSVVNPVDGQLVSTDSNNRISFSFIPSSGLAMTGCTLYTTRVLAGTYTADGTLNTVRNNSVNMINITTTASKQKISWYLSCSDSSGTTNTTASTLMYSKSKLVITEIKVSYEEQSTSSTPSRDMTYNLQDLFSGKITVPNVAQGSDVKITVYAENLYNTALDTDQTDIDNALLTVQSDDANVDESSDYNRIRSGDEKSTSVSFTLPMDLSASDRTNDFDFDISVEGDDGNGTTFTDSNTVTLTVTKPRYMIYIDKVALSNNVLSCQRDFTVSAKFSNGGYDDLSSVMMYVYSTDLGVSYVEKDMDLNSDITDFTNKNIPFTVKDSVAPGQYSLYIKFFQDNNENKPLYGGFAVANVEVQRCVPQPTTTTPATTTTTTTPATTTTTTPTTTNTNTNAGNGVVENYQPLPVTTATTASSDKDQKSSSSSLFGNDVLTIGLLASFNVLLLLVGIFMIVKLARK